jgi:hypothetical protein
MATSEKPRPVNSRALAVTSHCCESEPVRGMLPTENDVCASLQSPPTAMMS